MLTKNITVLKQSFHFAYQYQYYKQYYNKFHYEPPAGVSVALQKCAGHRGAHSRSGFYGGCCVGFADGVALMGDYLAVNAIPGNERSRHGGGGVDGAYIDGFEKVKGA